VQASERLGVTPRTPADDLVAQRRTLLRWYETRRAAYPWRRTGDPYAILVSELMLQQTQAARVVPAFERFIGRFPTVVALAAAERPAVIRTWDGLGYNRRAVSLWRTARVVAEEHDALVPNDVDVLRRLPGVGPYTAAAIASIAYRTPVPAIDTNVRRVVGRSLAGGDVQDAGEVERLAMRWLDRSRPGDWNQAVMDLGRALCRPRPRCDDCPLRGRCRFARSGSVVPTATKRASTFAGSTRQVRGDVVRVLRRRPSASIAMLSAETGHPSDRVSDAVVALVSDGILDAGAGALAGSARGRARLAR
jgi:A/G-specific adenine glycosylase